MNKSDLPAGHEPTTSGLTFWFSRVSSIAYKEALHLFRDKIMLLLAFSLPINEMIMLGYAVETNLRQVRTIILDQSRTQESRSLLQRFRNTDNFRLVGEVSTGEELYAALVRGEARVGIKLPENYARQMQAGKTAQLLVIVDGSDSRVALEAINVARAITLRESLDRAQQNGRLLVESRPQVLFNPDMRSANYFLPGVLVVFTQLMAITLSAFAIVREKENGTLEQLFMTPVQASDLILGKITPYLGLSFALFGLMTLLMKLVFGVPIQGPFIALLVLTFPFVLTMLVLGIWISTWVSTRDAAGQMAMATMVPSIFLSGYVFPLDSIPPVLQFVSYLVPTTWMIDAVRGVILRGAGLSDLWLHGVVLWGMAGGIILFTLAMFRKRI